MWVSFYSESLPFDSELDEARICLVYVYRVSFVYMWVSFVYTWVSFVYMWVSFDSELDDACVCLVYAYRLLFYHLVIEHVLSSRRTHSIVS